MLRALPLLEPPRPPIHPLIHAAPTLPLRQPRTPLARLFATLTTPCLHRSPAATHEKDDGFITVTNRRRCPHKSLGKNSATPSGNDFCPAPSQPPARTATHNALANPPAHQPARPSVSVTRQAPLHTIYLAFRVPVTEDFPISYDAVAALEEEHPTPTC